MNPTKRILPIILIVLILLTAGMVMAQDTDTPTPEEPAATQEATAFGTDEPTPAQTAEATPEVVTATPQATPIVIIITQPSDVPPVEPPPVTDGGNTFAVVGWVLFLLTLSALAFVVVTWIRELRKSAAAGDVNSQNLLKFVNATQNMLPVDVFLGMIDSLDKRAKTTPTPGEIDDKVMAQLRAYVYEALGKELPVDPTAPGNVAG